MSPVPVYLVGWAEHVTERLDLAWSAALLFGALVVMCLVALTVALLVRR